MTTKRQRVNALDTFIARKAEIDTLLAELQLRSDDHFGVAPDEVDWGHVGSLGHTLELLQRAKEGVLWDHPQRLMERYIERFGTDLTTFGREPWIWDAMKEALRTGVPVPEPKLPPGCVL